MNNLQPQVEKIGDICIIENVLPQNYIDALEQYLTTSDTFLYAPKTSYLNHNLPDVLNNESLIFDIGQLCKIIYKDGNTLDAEAINFLYPVLYTVQHIVPELNIKSLNRVKVNGLTKGGKDAENKINLPHHDNFDGYAAVLYLNDADGDTKIFDLYYTKDNQDFSFAANVTSIKPQKNKMVIFPANKWHASCSPVHSSIRWVINLNFAN